MNPIVFTFAVAALLLNVHQANASIVYEYRGGWDSFSSSSAPGSARELLNNTAFSSPLTLLTPNIVEEDLHVSSAQKSGIDFHGTLKTPQYETGQGRGQGYLYVMGLDKLTVKSGWQTLVSNDFTWASSTWSLAIDTSLGLKQVKVQGFWRNSAGVVSTYYMGTADLSQYEHTTVAFGMQRLTAQGDRVGTFFYANGSSQMLNNGSLIAHNNGNPLGNAVLGLGPQSGQTANGNQGTYDLENVYVYNMWTNSTAINASDLQKLTSAAHARRDGDAIPEPSAIFMLSLGSAFLFVRRKGSI